MSDGGENLWLTDEGNPLTGAKKYPTLIPSGLYALKIMDAALEGFVTIS